MVKVSVRLPETEQLDDVKAEIMSETESSRIWVLDSIEVDSQILADKIIARYNLERQERKNPVSLKSVLSLINSEGNSMVFVVTQITNWDKCRGSHSIAAQYQAKVLSATELQGVVTSEAIAVDDREIGEKIVAKFHYERDIKKSKISLASALELVREDMKKQQDQDGKGVDRIARLQAESEKDSLDFALRERALLRLGLLSEIMPVLIEQNLANFSKYGDSDDLLSKKAVVQSGFEYVDEMIAQSGLDDS